MWFEYSNVEARYKYHPAARIWLMLLWHDTCVVLCYLGHLLQWMVVLAISDIWCLCLTGYSPLSVPQFISQSALIDCCPDIFWWIVCEYYLVLDIGNLWSRVFKMFQSLSRHHWYNQNHTSLMVAKQYQNWPLHYENKYVQKFFAKLYKVSFGYYRSVLPSSFIWNGCTKHIWMVECHVL